MSGEGGGREDPTGKPLVSVPAPAASPAPAALAKLVLDSLASEHSRRAYHRALGEFFTWCWRQLWAAMLICTLVSFKLMRTNPARVTPTAAPNDGDGRSDGLPRATGLSR